MPENRQPSSVPTHESQRWLSTQLAYTKDFHRATNNDGREQRAAAAIATRLFSSFLEFSLVEHARSVYKYMLEYFPVKETAIRPDEPAVVSALTACLIRWQNEVEEMAYPTKEEAAAVSKELTILTLFLLHSLWVMEVPDLPQSASAADGEAEMLLAAIGYPRERLIKALTENGLGATSAMLHGLVGRLAAVIRQAADDELAEALQNLSYPQRLTKRKAQVLRDQIAEEIQQDNLLRQYFSVRHRIEVESAGSIEYQIHLYFDAYSRHYGEMWIRNEKHWREETNKIRQEVKEGAM